MQIAFRPRIDLPAEIQLVDGVRLLDLEPPANDLLSDALAGLQARPRSLPCKYFYDARGSELFEQITRLPEYYPTRTELSIMAARREAIAAAVGADALVVELGSGSGEKTERLIASLDRPAGLVLVDISRDALIASARALRARFGELDVLAVCADYTKSLALPRPAPAPRRVVAYFPGSTIGNFGPAEAERFLAGIARMVGPGGGLVLGVDRVKDTATLEAAYDDRAGVTAAFNLNLVERLAAAGAIINPGLFAHRAVFDERARRIEMYLVSTAPQLVRIRNTSIALAEGEAICTEHSHKYDLASLRALAARAGFALREHWSDEREWFSICHFEVAGAGERAGTSR